MAKRSPKSPAPDPWLATALIWLGRASLIAAVVGSIGKHLGKAAREVQKLLRDENGKPRALPFPAEVASDEN